ncbi:MAG TPA: hypothetical protein VEU09_09520 [Candidatus Binatia bacterium]|nr:hypothetical protein [Candidatus Binatia bacterium]
MSSALRQGLAFTLILLAAVAGRPALALGKDPSVIHGKQTLPLTTVDFAGHRYVVTADLGLGAPVRLMVHGNARMFLQLTHKIGERLNRGPVKRLEAYGYSSKGRGAIDVPMMRVGSRRFPPLRRVPVFDFTADGSGPFQGMVGVPFLVGERAAVDFSRDVLILGVPLSAPPNQELLALGYKGAPFMIDVSNRVRMKAYFPSLDSAVTITPSTVSNALTLHHALFAGRVPQRPDTTGTDHSPSGTSPKVFLSDAVAFEIAGVRFMSPASLENFAEYANTPESELRSVGLLGFDWMKEHAAILDYANHYLYFKP